MNGWHAVSGLLVAVPAMLMASRPHLVALLHFATSTIFLAGAAHYFVGEHRSTR